MGFFKVLKTVPAALALGASPFAERGLFGMIMPSVDEGTPVSALSERYSGGDIGAGLMLLDLAYFSNTPNLKYTGFGFRALEISPARLAEARRLALELAGRGAGGFQLGSVLTDFRSHEAGVAPVEFRSDYEKFARASGDAGAMATLFYWKFAGLFGGRDTEGAAEIFDSMAGLGAERIARIFQKFHLGDAEAKEAFAFLLPKFSAAERDTPAFLEMLRRNCGDSGAAVAEAVRILGAPDAGGRILKEGGARSRILFCLMEWLEERGDWAEFLRWSEAFPIGGPEGVGNSSSEIYLGRALAVAAERFGADSREFEKVAGRFERELGSARGMCAAAGLLASAPHGAAETAAAAEKCAEKAFGAGSLRGGIVLAEILYSRGDYAGAEGALRGVLKLAGAAPEGRCADGGGFLFARMPFSSRTAGFSPADAAAIARQGLFFVSLASPEPEKLAEGAELLRESAGMGNSMSAALLFALGRSGIVPDSGGEPGRELRREPAGGKFGRMADSAFFCIENALLGRAGAEGPGCGVLKARAAAVSAARRAFAKEADSAAPAAPALDAEVWWHSFDFEKFRALVDSAQGRGYSENADVRAEIMRCCAMDFGCALGLYFACLSEGVVFERNPGRAEFVFDILRDRLGSDAAAMEVARAYCAFAPLRDPARAARWSAKTRRSPAPEELARECPSYGPGPM